jgi:NAD-dependent deacetylase
VGVAVPDAPNAPIARARDLLRAARRIVAVTGAGISAESGVPTFRGAQGLWKSHRPEELATPQAFRADPRLVWEWYAWRRGLVAACRPNPAHAALARAALARPGAVRIVTQNVDGLHAAAAREEAGGKDASPGLPLELHGSLFRVRCAAGCGYDREDRGAVDASTVEALPRCPRCDSLVRPAVVWFGESLDGAVLSSAFDAATTADVCLVVGTSAVVHPAASIPISTLQAGGHVVEVNPDPTPLTRATTVSIRAKAGDVLPDLLDAV